MASLFDLHLKLLWDDERVTAVKRIRPIMEEIPAESDSHIPEIITALTLTTEQLEEAMGRVLRSEITAKMKAEDETRDNALKAIDDAIDYFIRKRTARHRDAAALLKEKFDKAFTGVSLSNNTLETNRIDLFAEECNTPEIQNALNVLDIVIDFNEMVEANSLYETLLQERAAQKESDSTPLLAPSRNSLHREISYLEEYLQFRIRQGSEIHQDLAEKIAEPLKEIMAVARARQTRKGNSEQ